jgi:hypothetical protein
MTGAASGITATELAVGAGTAAVGAGLSAYANNQALKRQDAIAAQGIIRQGALRAQAQQDVSKTITDTATNNQANIDRNRMTQQQEYAAALQRAAPVQSGSIVAQPGASKRYAADVMSARGDVAKFGSDLGASTAAIDAPQITALQTQEKLGDTATKLGLLNDTSNSQNKLTELQVNAVKANPWITAAGQALEGAGSGYIAGYYGKKKPVVGSYEGAV